MITDKKLGLKVAVDEIEALWETVRIEAETLIKQSKNNILVQEGMLELAKSKLKNYGNNNNK